MNKRLKKMMSSMVIMSALIAPTQMVFASDLANNSSIEVETGNIVMPLEIMQKSKTITKTYSSLSSVPESIVYEEYTGTTWWSGTLTCEKVVKMGSSYEATFSGTLIGHS